MTHAIHDPRDIIGPQVRTVPTATLLAVIRSTNPYSDRHGEAHAYALAELQRRKPRR